LLCYHSVIPGRLNAHGLADEQMLLLDAMDLAAYCIPTTLLNEIFHEGVFSGVSDRHGGAAVASRPPAARRHPPGRL
jgi:hypothetical protein